MYADVAQWLERRLAMAEVASSTLVIRSNFVPGIVSISMANSHGLSSRVVKKQAAARKLSRNKKIAAKVFYGNENWDTRTNMSYKTRKRYYQNKQSFPSRRLPTKNIPQLIEMGIIDNRGFFRKGKKKNLITQSMVDEKGLDFYGMPRSK